MLTFSDNAGENIQMFLQEWGRDHLVCRATFADGTVKEVQLQPKDFPLTQFGTIMVRDFSADRMGPSYLIDLYGNPASGGKHVTDLFIY